jgi:phage terminase large subunit-like protein
VPRGEVKDLIRKACREMRVAELAADSWLWQDALEELAEEGIPVVEFQQSPTTMGPATQRFYELVQNRKIRHDGDPRLARHLANAQIRTDERGARLVKDARNSPRKIDLAVAGLMAVDRSAYWLTQDPPGWFLGKPVAQHRFVW